MVFGLEAFRNAQEILDEIEKLCEKLFDGKPVCCIIPVGMRGARRLALRAGMRKQDEVSRPLSGVVVSCEVYRR